MTPKDIIANLVDKAYGYQLWHGRGTGYTNKTQRERNEDAENVGQLVLRSSDADREKLQALTSEDMKSIKWPPYDYVPYITDPATKKMVVDRTVRLSRKRGPVLIKLW